MNKSELIDRYIQKKATAGEMEKIKQLMEEDADFKKEVIFQLELQKAVKMEESQKLKLHLQSLERKKTMKRFIPELWKVAAVFIVGLGLFWFFNTTNDYEKIYKNNFEPYPNIVAPTVRDFNNSESNIEEAFRHYDNRDYAKAAATFKIVYDEQKIGYANFYYGVSLMADHQVENAVIALENPDWIIPERYQYQTDWYLALGFLEIKNKEKAITYLEKVIKGNGARTSQAKKILSEIE